MRVNTLLLLMITHSRCSASNHTFLLQPVGVRGDLPQILESQCPSALTMSKSTYRVLLRTYAQAQATKAGQREE